jgi:hypothetical protein
MHFSINIYVLNILTFDSTLTSQYTLLFFSEVIIATDAARWLVDQTGMRGVHGLHFSLTKSLTRNCIS